MSNRTPAGPDEMAAPPFRPLTEEQSALFEANPNPVLILDGQFRVRYVNPATAAYGAVDPATLIGEHIWTRYPALRDSIFSRAYAAVMREGRATRFEDRDADRDRWSAVCAYPFEGGVVAILEDITERRASERALAASEEALARAQSLAAIGSWSYSRTDGLQLSVEAYRLLGLDPTDAHADLATIAARLHPAERLQIGDAIARATPHDDVHMTVHFARFDGEAIMLDVLARAMPAEGARTPHFYGTIQDVSARIRASEELRKSERTLRLAQEAADIGIFDRDLRTGDTRWSDQLMRIVGLAPAEVDQQRLGRDPLYNFVHPADSEIVRDTFRRAIETGEKQVLRNRIVRADGTVRHLMCSAMLVRDEVGEPARVVGTAIDITDQVLAEEQRQQLEAQIQQAQKLESLGILAGGIAHDFNNLLVGILGNASLALIDLDESHGSYRSLAEIERAAQRAAELTRQLLAYAGKGRFVVEAIDASAVVHEMSALLRTAISRSASMQLDLASALPAIDVDATQFRQVVMNLITNASDAVGEPGGLITLRTGVREVSEAYLHACVPGTACAPGTFVYVEVSDTGVGMDAATVARVFDPFFSTKFTGRGLGLAATLGIMRSHHGAIRVYSEIGKGTSFSLLFPASAGKAVSAPPVRPREWTGSGHVLIVDDEASVCAVTTSLLTRRGFTVESANDGRSAVSLVAANPDRYSLVLLDLTMPGMDGQATFRELREIRDNLRVLLMSGYNEQEVTRLFVGRGLAGFLQKPFRAHELYEKVAQTLGLTGPSND